MRHQWSPARRLWHRTCAAAGRAMDFCAAWSDRIAVPIVCAIILAVAFCGEWLEAIGKELW